MELEFSVDPLFKKASADFDEGGAKGLLLNHLAIDASGRIVFDSSDDAGDATAEAENVRRQSGATTDDGTVDEAKFETEDSQHQTPPAPLDIDALRSRFFPDLTKLDDQDICPSLKNLDLGDMSGSSDIPFLKAPEDWRQEKEDAPTDGWGDKSGIDLNDDHAPGFDDDDGVAGGFDVIADAAFGDGGEAWAKNAAIEPQLRVHDEGYDLGVVDDGNKGDAMGVGGFDPDHGQPTVSLYHHKREGDHEDILSYFDHALKKNWAGPEHWRIRRMKDATRAAGTAPTKRKEKEPFEIDFLSPLDSSMAELIYTPATSNASISLPKAQWRSKTRNLLPDDKHFNSRQLLRLFLKPEARIISRKSGHGHPYGRPGTKPEEIPDGEMDEAFWARPENMADPSLGPDQAQGNYDANFFQDDGLAIPGRPPDDDDEFADAREAFSPEVGDDPAAGAAGIAEVMANSDGHPDGAFGTQLVTQSRRLRPEYVQYARVAKKVDVRRLKEEMWRGIGFEPVRVGVPSRSHDRLTSIQDVSPPAATPSEPSAKSDDGVLKFTSVMNQLQTVYPPPAMADISTSYCFICLLHLANEKGLLLGNEAGLEELSIRKDFTAEITEGGD